MGDIPGKKITEEDTITTLTADTDWLIIAREIGGGNAKINSTDIKQDFTGTESDTIDAAGEISISNAEPVNLMTVDTFGGGATDDLVKINGGHPGQLIIIQATDSARTIVIKNGANIRCAGGVDFSLDHIDDKWHGVVVSANNIDEISRSNNS